MSLDDLYQQQQDDNEAIRRTRQMAWDKLKEKHQAMYSAMGGEDQLTPEQTLQIKRDHENFTREWSADKGRIIKEADRRHKEERLNEASGTTPEGREERKMRLFAEQKEIINRQKAAKQNQPQPSTTPANENTSHLTDKQQRMLKLLEEQKAIAERNKAKKNTK